MFGRRAAAVPDYPYSPALSKLKVTWNDKTLDAYIKCMDDIDRDLIAQAVRDGKLNGATAEPTKATKDLQTVVQTCQEVVQK